MTDGSRVQVCGALRVVIGGRDVGDAIPAGQARVLLTYLVLTRARPTERSALPGILWACDPPPAADRVVAALLSRLRAVVGAKVLPARSDPRLHLPEPAVVDIETARTYAHTADTAVAARDWRSAWVAARVALGVAQRPLLTGVDLPWAAAENERLGDIRWRAWEAIAATGLALGGAELVSSRRAAHELMREEPLRESGYRLAMQASLAMGNPAEALATYERLRSRLATDLGVDPGPESRSLFSEVLARTAS